MTASGATAGSKRRRHAAGHAAASISDDGRVIEDDPDVGPNGGPKHWTDMEKNNLFTWLLCSDEHWDAFKTKMNTVFREVSPAIFYSFPVPFWYPHESDTSNSDTTCLILQGIYSTLWRPQVLYSFEELLPPQHRDLQADPCL